MTKVTLAAGITALVVVIIVHGGFNGYAIWNAVPIPVALLPLIIGKSERGIKYGIYSFGWTIVLLVLGIHVSYFAAAGESAATDARFLTLPLIAVGSGYIAAMAGALCGVLLEARMSPGLPTSGGEE